MYRRLHRQVAVATAVIGVIVMLVIARAISLKQSRIERCLRSAESASDHSTRKSAIASYFHRTDKYEAARSIFNAWGRRNSQVDLAVIEAMSYGSNDSFIEFDERILYEVQQRVREDRSLLRQIFWHKCWVLANAETNICGLRPQSLSMTIDGIGSRSHLPREQISWMLFFASAFDDPRIIEGITPYSREPRWESLIAYLKNNRDCFVYNAQAERFEIDKEAQQSGLPVDEERQRFPKPSTPLP